MNKKLPQIKYTAKDFDSIKKELVEYSKRYYPETYSDFNKASFGSLVLDTVSYVGDVLSFYLDYQYNESMLNTAIEFDNILKISKQLGYKYNPKSTAYGFVTLYVSVPASSNGLGPDTNYLPILKKGSSFSSTGGQTFTLFQDVDFSNTANEVIVSNVDSITGTPISYAIKTFGIVQSGFYSQKFISIGNFERFKKIELDDINVLEIVSVYDSDGNEYYEVENLSQDVIFKEVSNNNFQADGVPSILKPFPVPRRFVVEKTRTSTMLQFGYGSEDELSNPSVVEPSQNIIQLHGRKYSSATSFDPTNLIKTDKFGVSPSNTNLTILYRKSNSIASNVAANSITRVKNTSFTFPYFENTNAQGRSAVQLSLEANNEDPLVGEVRLDAAEELKRNTLDYYASQNRAVSLLDYQASIYNMPSNFGRVKRCSIVQDTNSFKRNLNIYVISETNAGTLTTANSIVKGNIKTWLTQYKMINDTIDILDGIVINFGIEFNIIIDSYYDRADTLNKALTEIQLMFTNTKMDIGQSISIADIYSKLNRVTGVVDTTNVSIVQKYGGLYSSIAIDLDNLTTFDGKYVNCPKNVVYEVKYPALDVKGTVS